MEKDLPFAHRQPLRVDILALESGEEQLDRRSIIAVGPGEDDWNLVLFEELNHHC